MLLYDSPVSGNCYKVRLLLAHLGVPYERRTVDVVDRSNRLELLGELNPALRVPTLVLDDGRSLGESGAILWYFGEGTRFVPADAYDRLEERTAAGYRALEAMERDLADAREWFVGRGMSLADIALYAYTHVADEGGFELGRFPHIRGWLARVAAVPGHVPIDA